MMKREEHPISVPETIRRMIAGKAFQADDIGMSKATVTDFDDAAADCDAAFVTCCQGTPVGLLLGRREGETVELTADYTTPAYRDCSVGRYLHDALPKTGVRRLRFTQTLTEQHRQYLEKMGYALRDGAWVLALD